MLAAEQFGDLHRIERGTLAQIVADAPDVQAIFDRWILADVTDEGCAVTNAFDRRDIAFVLALIDQHDAGCVAQDLLGILDLPEAVASKRAAARDRGGSDRIGGRDSAYHQAVMANFRQFAADEPERIRIIDAAQSVESITAMLVQNLGDLMS